MIVFKVLLLNAKLKEMQLSIHTTLLRLTMKSHQVHPMSHIYKLETKIELHLSFGSTSWIPKLSILAGTWSIALLFPKLQLIYGGIIYNAVLDDFQLLPESVSDSKTDYMLD